MSLFHSKLSSGFPTHSEEKSKPFQWLTKICSQFPLFPNFHTVGSLNSLRPPLSSPFQRAIPWWSYCKLKATPPPQPSPWPNWVDHHHYPTYNSHLFTVYLPHLEHNSASWLQNFFCLILSDSLLYPQLLQHIAGIQWVIAGWLNISYPFT